MAVLLRYDGTIAPENEAVQMIKQECRLRISKSHDSVFEGSVL